MHFEAFHLDICPVAWWISNWALWHHNLQAPAAPQPSTPMMGAAAKARESVILLCANLRSTSIVGNRRTSTKWGEGYPCFWALFGPSLNIVISYAVGVTLTMTCFNFLAFALGNWFMVSGDSAKRPALRILVDRSSLARWKACQGAGNLAFVGGIRLLHPPSWQRISHLRIRCTLHWWAANLQHHECCFPGRFGCLARAGPSSLRTSGDAAANASDAPADAPADTAADTAADPETGATGAGRVWKRSFYVFPFWVDHSFGWIVVNEMWCQCHP